ncbi:MAG TPA: iron ABC transporter permease [Sedimenticola thiotaurini]|uniref:Iron ABC transporter permease n=1 Tax=Sedimenticola thiotaurini TaxID=1543721 RepID=A0A831WC09_9GAMM|nr:iron ABC transporter permease [Sedimenticola thiotaurini]
MTAPRGHGLELLLGLLLALLFVSSLFIGSNPIPVWQALQQSLQPDPGVVGLILTEVRLPRTLVALFAGATLGLCGAAMQGLLRNPLASPGLVGSSSGAAFGAVLMIYFGSGGWYQVPIGGIAGSLGATLLVYLLAGRNAASITLILAGVAVNSLALALISLLLNLAPSPYAVQEIVLWMLGAISDLSLQDVAVLLPGTLAGWLLLVGSGRQLDALTLGEETARSMGVRLTRLRWRIFAAVALAVGSAVSVTGSIGFVGLVVPHLMRPLAGFLPGRLLPLSALGGAILLLAADIAVRLFPAGAEIKVGVVTALVGAPFFLYLVIRSRRWAP